MSAEIHTDVTATDLVHLRRCLELATEALAAGDDPFGSVLAGFDGEPLHEDRNRETTSGDPTAHPELALARWAAAHLTADDRAAATVYTSGEHCPMCAAAHAWVGIGRVVYIASSAQLSEWRADFGMPDAPVRPIPIREVAPRVTVVGPVPALIDGIRVLHERRAVGR